MCGFVTPLEGSEADSHRKPEVSNLYQIIMQIQETLYQRLNVWCFCILVTGYCTGGQLLEAKDRGGNQGVSQVEDLLQEEGKRL